MSDVNKRRIRWAILNGLFILSLVMGLIYGSEGLKNIAMFLTWFTVMVSFAYLSEDAIRSIKKRGGFSVRLSVETIFNVVVIFILAWSGCFISAGFYALSTLIIIAAYERVDRLVDDEVASAK